MIKIRDFQNMSTTLTVRLYHSFEVVHHQGAIAANLLCAAHCTESNLRELLLVIRPITNTADDPALLQESEGYVTAIKYQASNILLRHLGKLTRKYVLQVHQCDRTIVHTIVRHPLKGYVAILGINYCPSCTANLGRI